MLTRTKGRTVHNVFSAAATVLGLGLFGLGSVACSAAPAIERENDEVTTNGTDNSNTNSMAQGDASTTDNMPDLVFDNNNTGDNNGNNNDTTGMDAGGPPAPVCGNAMLEDGEECDDGNSKPADGCSGICTVETGYKCPTVGQACELDVTCGNQVIEVGETCDDGNNDLGDGCDATCKVEDGWACTANGCQKVDTSVCGDGMVGVGEQCDDGQDPPVAGDGCDSDCQVEDGWQCRTPGQACEPIITEYCGNATVVDPEECDDGNAAPGDGCSANCKIESGYICPSGMNCVVECGDGLVVGAEACDDSNQADGDGCSADCSTVEPGFVCPIAAGVGGACVESDPGPVCPNAKLEFGEQCDDGNSTDGDGCTGCVIDQGYRCPKIGQVCELLPFCGDGYVDVALSEQCDDGNMDSNDGCDNMCQVVDGWLCPAPVVSGNKLVGGDCRQIVCGDGAIEGGEECDDGNTAGSTLTCFGGTNDGESCVGDMDCSGTVPQAIGLVATDTFIDTDELLSQNITLQGSDSRALVVAVGVSADADGSVDTIQFNGVSMQQAAVTTVGVAAGSHRYVRLRGLTEVNGNEWSSIAEFNVLTTGNVPIDRSGWTVSTDSEELVDESAPATNAIDGDTSTFWHTEWGSYTAPLPHELIVDMGAAQNIVGFSYLPRQNGENGRIEDWEFSVSDDGSTWGTAVASGTFPNNGDLQTVPFNTTTVQLYYLTESDLPAPGGTYTLDVALNGNVTDAVYHVLQLDNVLDAAPDATGIQTDDTGADTLSTNITTTAANTWVVDAIATGTAALGNSGFIPTAGQLERADTNASASRAAIATKSVATASTAAFSWDCDGNCNQLAHALVAFAPAADIAAKCVPDGGDGCNANCEVDPGWVCPAAGQRCFATSCGDGILAGFEECESFTTSPSAACNWDCTFNRDYACEWDSAALKHNCVEVATACNNDGNLDLGERCDDGNNDTGDGCTPFCELEPDCTNITTLAGCESTCGDGVILASDVDEECDDGNAVDGDGCSSTCQVEGGWSCAIDTGTLPQVLNVPVTFRDFIALPNTGTRHADFQIFSGGAATTGLVQSVIGADGKPVYTGICDDATTFPAGECPYDQQLTTEANFDQWYNDTNGVNLSMVTTLPFQKVSGNTYSYLDNSLFPFTGGGWVASGEENAHSDGNNFGFTSEIRYWFEYQGDEQLSFSGDDDLWVFVNGHLAVDVGGVHPQTTGNVTLDATAATNYNLAVGNIYEISLFHAERHTTESNFNLTLGGFVKSTSTCTTVCGDGSVNGAEQCDDGMNNADGYGTCQTDCTLGSFCGDGIHDAGDEQCDDGVNNAVYSGSMNGACAPGCVWAPYCGDGIVEPGIEECDGGNDCEPDCTLSPVCGDGDLNIGEECDDGAQNGAIDSDCDVQCRIKCGNGETDAGEQCDPGTGNFSTSYDGCLPPAGNQAGCLLGPHCGDGVKNGPEECDDGLNDGSYGTCAPGCLLPPRCGDGVVQDLAGELCDEGDMNVLYNYSADGAGECTTGCRPVGYCGDGAVTNGEGCDDGVNDNSPGSCTDDCGEWVDLPSCGNGNLDPGEECDDAELNQTVNSDCDMNCRIRCGNGIKDEALGEECDDGVNDGRYGTCEPDCTLSPYCGDGQQNGPEQCDQGANNQSMPYGPGTCTTACTIGPYCGDGRVQAGNGEECDGQAGCATNCLWKEVR